MSFVIKLKSLSRLFSFYLIFFWTAMVFREFSTYEMVILSDSPGYWHLQQRLLSISVIVYCTQLHLRQMFWLMKCLWWIHRFYGCKTVEIFPHSGAIILIMIDLLFFLFFYYPFSTVQPSSAVLGEHPEESPLHLRRPRVWGGGRLTFCHRPDLHGRLHQERAQTQPGEWKQKVGRGGGIRWKSKWEDGDKDRAE